MYVFELNNISRPHSVVSAKCRDRSSDKLLVFRVGLHRLKPKLKTRRRLAHLKMRFRLHGFCQSIVNDDFKNGYFQKLHTYILSDVQS